MLYLFNLLWLLVFVFYFLDFFIFFYYLHFFFMNGFNIYSSFFSVFSNYLIEVFSYEKKMFLSSIFSFFIFLFLIICCYGGYFSYSICLCGSFEFTLFLAFSCWFTTFLCFISSESLSIYMSKSGDSYLKTFTMFLIEVVSELSRPIALTVRLTVNILVGHILVSSFYFLFEVFIGNFNSFLIILPILMECFVFIIQSYIFSRLIFLYLNE